ncbi:MAG: hypothetical protein A2Y82_01335 [Candidatus Buchananbacteria bacterium RBG_13_36_9]|uniref:Uncharacterized protein n=1 Tax=Candidatus Buchananbacteria bacterium RBG_13_36_9 TaxID=1797530 RepID=A0A1G1XNJ6_9BACT|nr:MAG: hypothetical protein A2Y82_01335 [Candidatus Buchananbacteria bacterium RBG_13_36_9]
MQRDGVRIKGSSGRKQKSDMAIACEILNQQTKGFLPTQRKCNGGFLPEVHVADLLTNSVATAKRIVNHIPTSYLSTMDPEEVARLQLAGHNGLDVLLFNDPTDGKLKLFPTPADMQKRKNN